MRNFFNPGRIYSLNDEAALVMCDWPKDKPKHNGPDENNRKQRFYKLRRNIIPIVFLLTHKTLHCEKRGDVKLEINAPPPEVSRMPPTLD